MELESYWKILLVGVGATATMDVWRFLLQKTVGVSSLDLGLLGRWVGHISRGKIFHTSIGKAEVIPNETKLGWAIHYLIGILFSLLLPILWGKRWLVNPTIIPSILVGVGTILAPWFLMQPAMGMGIAASKTPKPFQVRIRNIAIHTVYGLGLYGTAVLTNVLFR
ncbi:DUF2938 domain-containing protein [Leptospira montravelensis]|uniref:DUF2938 domain-containing protein n=1 Tax=Leptospira montravelensis TaxID=2484961 RepID=A0ABY2LNS0_9LEPT|nr:DUF2938 domain-containing protein [Leptospira montravelensis]TGK81127.1 DUF2938 domain-containing protein [Leptospira montravelensis]TGL01273.1 DUF2938 domain-containing protein [Leptospira montravelensis]